MLKFRRVCFQLFMGSVWIVFGRMLSGVGEVNRKVGESWGFVAYVVMYGEAGRWRPICEGSKVYRFNKYI